MASWMVHLRIAEQLLEQIDGLDACQFAIGNVAPDSGVVDENGRFHPPKEISHYTHYTEPRCMYLHRDACFYEDYLRDIEPTDKNRFSFLLGYLFHIVTDNLWITDIWRPTKNKFFGGQSPTDAYVREVKGDWVGQDFLYLQQHPESLFYQYFLDYEYNEPLFDLLPQENIEIALQRIKDFYLLDEVAFAERIDRPFLYLQQVDSDIFVENTAVLLYELYEMGWGSKKRPFPAIKRSLLECLSLNETIDVQN